MLTYQWIYFSGIIQCYSFSSDAFYWQCELLRVCVQIRLKCLKFGVVESC